MKAESSVAVADEDLFTFATQTSEHREKILELQASIAYASRIQRALLPAAENFCSAFADAFVYYNPKDVLSGDFYWLFPYGDQVYFAVGDCTGHGIPGAMVSMAAMTVLRHVIRIKGLDNPAEILTLLDREITELFNENLVDGVTRDGMDVGFGRYDKKAGVLYYAGANRPLIRVRNGALHEWDGNRFPVGYYDLGHKEFTCETIPLVAGDLFYLFTDGYTDQFGGSNVKKFNRGRFRSLLCSLFEMDMKRQHHELEMTFHDWKGKHDQIDDVCVVGIRF